MTTPDAIEMRCYIGLGSNLGDRKQHLRDAIDAIGRIGRTSVLRSSGFYETAPVGGPRQPDYLNAALEIATSLEPPGLLDELQRIEAAMGRTREVHWGPRAIDLDILLCGDVVLNTPRLTVPHPLMHGRRFVLEPLSEIAPDVVHPVLKKSISALLSEQEVDDS